MKKLILKTIYFLISYFLIGLFTYGVFYAICEMIKYFNSLYLNLIELKYFIVPPISNLLFIYTFKKYFIHHKIPFKSMLNLKFINLKNSIYIIIFTLGQVVIISIFIGLLSKYIYEDNPINYSNSTHIKFFLEVLSVCIIAPILEEIIFRGLLLNYFKKESNIIVAIILQAVLFAAVHGAFLQMIYTFVSGILFAIINIHYKSICASICSHITLNILGSILLPVITPFINNFALEALFLSFGILCFSFGAFKIFGVKKEKYLNKFIKFNNN